MSCIDGRYKNLILVSSSFLRLNLYITFLRLNLVVCRHCFTKHVLCNNIIV